MLFDLWYHDGTGFGYPALPIRSHVELVEVEVNGVVHQEERIFRTIQVFGDGSAAAKKAGLDGPITILTDVPEGSPIEKGTVSHTPWQPGSQAHRDSVLHGLGGEEYVVRAIEHGYLKTKDKAKAIEIVERKFPATDQAIDSRGITRALSDGGLIK